MKCTSGLFLVFMVLASNLLSAQKGLPNSGYFRSPIGHKIVLSGSFGELRSNHFHMGLDIKSSKGTVGDPIYAAADGYVARIKQEASGYGNAIYMNHPNGLSTVYGHLNNFNATILSTIRKEQYRQKSFEVNIYPSDTEIPVKKGEIIGWMGNKGRSFGPHLHFEIRNTKTETPINPMLFGIGPSDTKPPLLTALKMYCYDKNDNILYEETMPTKRLSKGIYGIDGDTILTPLSSSAFALAFYDQMNGASNKNGIYRLQMFVDNKEVFGFSVDSISFEESGYIKTHLDYEEHKSHKRDFTRCHRLQANRLLFTHENKGRAHINFRENETKNVIIQVSDYAGNVSKLSFWVIHISRAVTVEYSIYNFYLDRREEDTIQINNVKMIFPKEALLANERMFFEAEQPSAAMDDLSTIYHIGKESQGLLKPVHLYIDDLNIADSLRGNLVLISYDTDKIERYGGNYKNGIFDISLSSFGKYQLALDTISPTIKPINIKQIVSQKSIQFKITDNFEAANKSQRLVYRAEIDDQWVLFRYDLKNDLIEYTFDEYCPSGDHKLKLAVRDASGNTTTYKYSFSN